MPDESTSHPRLLPSVFRHAMWHDQSGLIVSPLSHALPSASHQSGDRDDDYTKPRKLGNHNIYLAFYPLRDTTSGDLLSILELLNKELQRCIVAMSETRYGLDEETLCPWHELEDILITISFCLLNGHKYAQHFPRLEYPQWPKSYGYRSWHRTKELAFAYSAFDSAFLHLANFPSNLINWSYLDFLTKSVVCNLTLGLHPGGFINPYDTQWFYGGNVDKKKIDALDVSIKDFLPPKNYIEIAKQRTLIFTHIILPTLIGSLIYLEDEPALGEVGDVSDNSEVSDSDEEGPQYLPEAHPSAHTNGPLPDFISPDNGNEFYDTANLNPDEPPPAPPVVDHKLLVHPLSGQCPGENWQEFFARMEVNIKKRDEKDSPRERQSRLDQERVTLKSGYMNMDMCHFLEQPEGQMDDEDDDDEEVDDMDDAAYNAMFPSVAVTNVTTNISQVARSAVDTVLLCHSTSSVEFVFSFQSLMDHLKFQYGFNAGSHLTWNTTLEQVKPEDMMFNAVLQ
ncbi:hypothetical protein CPB84DRAFT_1851639 [Gymnopilus junonius]|uniref:Uncharacterized protein n=1 Tax=Gymnopilus junonius TaxID=109634 RepID=A0A9P5THD7_GYMJU|nr:hypothetical protein CPB84DRAFT_1851639 [Gymnopilus junonius]